MTAEPVFLSDVRRSNHKRRRSFRDRSTIVKQAKSPSSEGNVHVHDMAEVLGNVKQFLVKRLRFSAEEASVYVAGLEEGTVTSVSLGKKVSLRPATVLGILRRLMDRGLFLSSLDDGSGKGHAVHYVAIQPEEAFRDFHKEYERFASDLDVLSEHLDVQAETGNRSNEMYLLRTKSSAVARGATLISGAKKSIKIYGHDISWLAKPELESALEAATRRRVEVDLLATDIHRHSERIVQKMGISPKRVGFHGIPFCVIDDSTLLLPHTGGDFGSDFGLLVTSNTYTVGNYLKTWDQIHSSVGLEAGSD